MKAIKHIKITNNDIYFLACVNDKIVINNNYTGVLILDKELNVLNAVEIIDDLIIHSYYTYQNNILLYCPENNVIVFLNVESGKYMTISLSGFENEIFGCIYEWVDDNVILSTSKGNFVCIDLVHRDSRMLCCNGCGFQVQKDFYLLQKYTVHKIFPGATKALVGKDKLYLIDYREHTVLLEEMKEEQYHDYELIGQHLIKISENKISITDCKNEVVLKPTNGYIYLRAKCLNDNGRDYIIILSSCNRNTENSIIEKYPVVY